MNRDEVTVTVHTPTDQLDENSCWEVVFRGASHDVPTDQETIDVTLFEGETVLARRKHVRKPSGQMAARAAAGNL